MFKLALLSVILFFSYCVFAEEAEKTKDDNENGYEVVVTASKTKTSAIDTPADVEVIKDERIHEPGKKNALEALNDSPGFEFNPRQDNGVFDHFQVRGLYSNSTSGGTMLIMVDGIPQRRLSFGGPYTGGLPLDSVSKIELVKGAMGSLYGRNALAGTMQLFTNPGTKEFHAKLSTTGDYELESVKSVAQITGPVFDIGTFSFTGTLLSAQGYVDDGLQKKGDAYLHTELDLTKKDKLKVLFGYVHAHNGRTSPQWIDENGERLDYEDRYRNYAVPGSYADIKEWRSALVYTHEFTKKLKLIAKTAYWHGDTIWTGGRLSDRPDNYTSDTSIVYKRSASRSDYNENVVFNELQFDWRFKLNSNFKGFLVTGASYEYLDWDFSQSSGTTKELLEANGNYSAGVPIDMLNPSDPDSDQIVYGPSSGRFTYEHNAGAFARTGLTIFERFNLEGGVRYDVFKRSQKSDEGRKVDYDNYAVSPSVGLNVAALKTKENKVNLYANWGMGFSPIFRAVNNVRFTNLEPEKSMSTEGGVKVSLFKNMFKAKALYYLMYRNDVTGWVKDPDHEGDSLGVNTGDWKIHGLEMDFSVNPYKNWFNLYGALTVRKGIIEKNNINEDREGNEIPMISPVSFTVGARTVLPVGFIAGAEYRWYSKRYADEDNNITLASYAILEGNAGWKFKVHDQAFLTTSFFISNALDADYVAGVGGDGSGYYGWFSTPRTFGIKATLDI